MKLTRRLRDFALTAGTLGSTGGQTVMVAVFPVLLAQHAPSALWVGLAVGSEGALALLVPYTVGLLSDRLPQWIVARFGRRLFFLLVAAPIMAGTMAVVPFLSGYWLMAGAGVVFFAALHVYLTPLWALMVDEVPARRWGSVQGVRGVFHSVGLAFGLVAGGLLYSVWEPLPFLLGGALILATTALTWAAENARAAKDRSQATHEESGWKELARKPEARWFLAANTLWTGGVDGLRPYFFLFAVTVLGVTMGEASLLLILLVLGLGASSAVLGRIGDRYDRGALLRIGVVVTGVVLLAGIFVRTLFSAVPLLLIAGIGAAAVMALPFPIYAGLTGGKATGQSTGLYVTSLGVGRMIAPVLVGAAIDLGARWFPEEEGYPLMWPIAGVLMLLGAWALTRSLALAHAEEKPEP